MKKKSLGSFPFYGLVLSMTLALFLVGLFGVLLGAAKNVVDYIKENIEVQIFLDKKITPQQMFHVRKVLEGMDFVARSESGPAITFVSREESAEKFIRETGEDFAKYIGDNPFRDAFIVKIDAAYHTPEHFDLIAKKIGHIAGVFEVIYVEKVVEKISRNFARIGSVLVGVAGLLFLAALLIINNSLRLAMFSQRFLIRSMQLVGATSHFIKRPFLIRGILYGFLSSVAACLAIHTVLVFSHEYLPELREINLFSLIRWIYLFVFGMGILTSFSSIYFAVNKYLRMSLDQLY